MTIGETIKALRRSKKMTRDEVANALGYTKDYIKKLERINSEPSLQSLELLSKLFNCDLKKYRLVLKEFTSIEAFNNFRELRQYISLGDIENIKRLAILLEEDHNFRHGEPRQLIIYSKALEQCLLNKNFELAKNLCIEGLKIDVPNFTIESIDSTLFSNTSYSLLVCLSAQYIYLNDIEKSKFIVISTYNNFENVVFNSNLELNYHSFHLKKIQIITINNYADILFRERNYTYSLELCNKAIALCNKYETTNSLELLYKLKFENLYKLDMIEEAQESFEIFKALCIVKNKKSYLKLTTNSVIQNYPLLVK